VSLMTLGAAHLRPRPSLSKAGSLFKSAVLSKSIYLSLWSTWFDSS